MISDCQIELATLVISINLRNMYVAELVGIAFVTWSTIENE